LLAAAPLASARPAFPVPAAQVSDILNAVGNAITGKKKTRRRYRRYKGSDKPILAKTPVTPARKPGALIAQLPQTDEANVTPPEPSDATRRTAALAPPQPTLKSALDQPAASSKQTAGQGTALPTPSLKPSSPALPTRAQKTASLPPTTDTATDAVSAIPPPPTVWQPEEISAAYERCDTLSLAKASRSFRPSQCAKAPAAWPAPSN